MTTNVYLLSYKVPFIILRF